VAQFPSIKAKRMLAVLKILVGDVGLDEEEATEVL